MQGIRLPLFAATVVIVALVVAPLLWAQLTPEQRADAGLAAIAKVTADITNLRNAIADRLRTLHDSDKKAGAAVDGENTRESTEALRKLDSKAAQILNGSSTEPGIVAIRRKLARAKEMLRSTDAGSQDSAKTALDKSCGVLNKRLAAWRDLDSHAVPATTNIIAKSSLAALPTVTVMSIMSTPNGATPADACAP